MSDDYNRFVVSFRKRFETHWKADCAFFSDTDAVNYVDMIMEKVEEAAEGLVHDMQRRCSIHAKEARRCANCRHWIEDAKAEPADEYTRTGLCYVIPDPHGPHPGPAAVWCGKSPVRTHEDFLCILYRPDLIKKGESDG